MPKPLSITIHLPEPCSESWDEMKSNGCGRFCKYCEKTVIDFTQMTDEEVVEIMVNATNIPCGRFDEKQLNRPFLITQTKTAKPFPYLLSKVAASFLLMQTLVNNAFAQKSIQTNIEQVSGAVSSPKGNHLILEGTIKDYIDEGQRKLFTELQKDSSIATSETVRNFINGFEPHLIGMEISVSGLSYVKYTDKNGYFRFVLPDSFKGKKLVVSAKYQPTSSPEKAGTTLRSEEIIIENNDTLKTVQLFRYKVQQLNSVRVEAQDPAVESHFGGLPSVVIVKTVHKPTIWGKLKRVFKKKNDDENN